MLHKPYLKKNNSQSSPGWMRWPHSSGAGCVLQLRWTWSLNVAYITQTFLGRGVLYYCTRPTGGAVDTFTVFPGLVSSIFEQFTVKRQKESILCILSHRNIPKRRRSAAKSKTFVFLENARVSVCLMWRDVFLRSETMMLHVLFDEEKSNVCSFFSFKCIFRFVFSTCAFNVTKIKGEVTDSEFDVLWRYLRT